MFFPYGFRSEHSYKLIVLIQSLKAMGGLLEYMYLYYDTTICVHQFL